uniref:Uncharacterized protein n=1 Tax=Rhizophora mucronata TaxID=61149 RepID=A0A2P2NC30_RHIMU
MISQFRLFFAGTKY